MSHPEFIAVESAKSAEDGKRTPAKAYSETIEGRRTPTRGHSPQPHRPRPYYTTMPFLPYIVGTGEVVWMGMSRSSELGPLVGVRRLHTIPKCRYFLFKMRDDSCSCLFTVDVISPFQCLTVPMCQVRPGFVGRLEKFLKNLFR
jgi:hypothetical protein